RAELPRRDPVRHAFRRLLLEEARRADSLAIALHREGTVAQVRHDRGTDPLVVLEEITLRDSVLGEEDAFGRAQIDRLRLSHPAPLPSPRAFAPIRSALCHAGAAHPSSRRTRSSSARPPTPAASRLHAARAAHRDERAGRRRLVRSTRARPRDPRATTPRL